jgi:hypothetical protein
MRRIKNPKKYTPFLREQLFRREFTWEDLPPPVGSGIGVFDAFAQKAGAAVYNFEWFARDPIGHAAYGPYDPEFVETPMAEYQVKNLRLEIEEASDGNLKIHLSGDLEREVPGGLGSLSLEVKQKEYFDYWDPSILHDYEEKATVDGRVWLWGQKTYGDTTVDHLGSSSMALKRTFYQSEGPIWEMNPDSSVQTVWKSEGVGGNGEGGIDVTIAGKVEDLEGVEFQLKDSSIAGLNGATVAVDIGTLASGVSGVNKAHKAGDAVLTGVKGVSAVNTGGDVGENIINLDSPTIPLWFDENGDLWIKTENGEDIKFDMKEITPPIAGGGDWDPEFEETWYWEGWDYPQTDVDYENYPYVDKSGAYDWDYDQSEIEEAWEWAPYI